MALQISDTTPRSQYTATAGQTTFSVPFEFFNVADLKVYNGTSLLTYSTSPSSASQYSVTGAGVTGGGSITLGSPGATLNDTITIVRDLAIERISDFPVSGNFPIQTLNTELDKIVAMLQQLEEQFGRTLQYPVTTTTGFNVDLPELVANRVLSVNADATALLANQELGTLRGDWAASTSYKIRDLVKDTSNGNIYFVNTAHTSSGSQPLSSNANSSYYDLIVDAAAATTSATNAASSATAAASSASAASTSATAAQTAKTAAELAETNAETAQAAAETAQTGAETAETNAGTSATAAASSATSAATQATNAATSASAASTSATNAATSATNAATSASNASTSETNAATSETNAASSASTASTQASNAATSASAASTSATNAATSETNASNSASAASTSATNAANSASAAATSAASAASAYDTFDDRYLGSKTSDPTLDNDGNALVTGALYFNSTANEMRVYDGGNWIPASSAGTASLILYEYTATSGQTTFSGTDDNSATLSYSVNNLIVTLNGITLDPSDYTATSGTSIVLGTGATTGDLLNVYAFKSFTVSELNANNLTDGTIPDARFPAVLPAISGANLTGIISDVVEDTTPQLGGSLDLNSNNITGTGNVNITGTVTATSFSGDGSSLTGITSTTINNNADNRVITGSATANTLEGEANLTFDGNTLNVSPNSGYLRIKAGTTDATNNVRLEAGGTVNTYLEYRGYLGHIFDVDTTEAMRIDNSGQVGIGTSSPSAELHISKNADGGNAEILLENSFTSAGSTDEWTQIQGRFGGYDASYIRTGKEADFTTAGNRSSFMSFWTRNAGTLAEAMRINSAGHLLPATTNTNDLGSSSLVWRNIYTSDFHMSNEGLDKGNDIDGTKGSWTFQEGEENLYLINNKNGKKYKFNLTEIE